MNLLRLLSLVLVLTIAACSPAPEPPASEPPQANMAEAQAASPSPPPAKFGRYENPQSAQWDGWSRTSQYIPAKDGTRLAVDVYLPSRDGMTPESPVPVVLHYTRYIRAVELEDGSIRTNVDNNSVLQHLLRHGYAVAVADARGTGASFGVHHGAFSVEETRDSYVIIEWLASQPWSNGRVGMQGRSYPGMTQYQAATQAPPSLKAIFPEMAGPSAYDFIYRGGAFKKDFIDVWGSATRKMDEGASNPAPVDEDPDGVLRDEAVAEHAANLWAQGLIQEGSNFRSFAIDREGGGHWSWDRVIATIDDADAIAGSGVAIYHLVGWFDIYTTQQPWLYATLEGRVPQKMIIGPWLHSGGYGGTVHNAEILRWYDYWLKGIENGVMDEAPVHYFVMEANNTLADDGSGMISADDEAAEEGGNWIATREWPPASDSTTLWLTEGVAAFDAPQGSGADPYTVDYSAQMGPFSRWSNGYGGRREAPEGSTLFDERSAENARALTYTTAPMESDLTIVGYPVANLWVRSSHSDGDFFVYLEEIDAEGRSHYISEGVIRASFRKTSKAPFDNFDLPYLRSHAEDLEDMVPGEPTRLSFDIMGTAIVIDRGHRLRVSITGADARNFALYPDPDGQDAPEVEILWGGDQASFIELPVAR